ncbi:MAG: hypothetical protein P4M00_15050 [Azospirillaceae bacterium]|nr:hypothetical protein [Azospirillaceae bacterium]
MSVFDQAAILASLRADRLPQVADTYFPGASLSDSYLWGKVCASVADIERRLRLFLTPHEVLPEAAPQAEIDALIAADPDVPITLEPGYDYDPKLFRGDDWGLITVRHRPIIAVHRIDFVSPAANDTLWTVPCEWIRLDRKYGQINLVPAQRAITLPLSAFVMSVLGGGTTVPLMVQVRYRAGLGRAPADRLAADPDLDDLIKTMIVLSIIGDVFVPQSGKASVDGLSQSRSIGIERFRSDIEQRIEALRQSMAGVRLTVLG